MNMDMTKGNPTKLILLFALPLFASNLFQQFYNLADTAIVGHILGDQALSAVGAVSSIYALMTSICFGMTNGFSILISKYFGAKDEKRQKQAMAGTVLLSMVVAVVMTIVCCLLLKPFMAALHTPEEIFQDAYTYIVIIVGAMVVMVFYNMLASILRAVGNSRTPLLFLVISSFLNIVLDFLFIGVCSFGIAGAAWATVLSQLVSGILCLFYMVKKCPELSLCKADFSLTVNMTSELLSSGFAMSLMYAVVNVGTVILQSGINQLGTSTIAAHVAARKISEIYMMPCSTLSATMTTFASQNYGAGKMHRVLEGVKKSHILGFGWSTIAITITYLFANPIIAALTGSGNVEIIATGANYLKINLPFYYVLIVLCIMRSTLQGIGRKFWPVVASTLEMLGKLIVVVLFIEPLGYTAVCFCEPVTWIICCVPVCIAFFTHPGIQKLRRTIEENQETAMQQNE